ncbi:MAG: PH domain-containing protein [Nitrososphaerota archaeon]|nr:PH domain-containing protein [Nitrososphaerota archaeon]
MEGDKDVVWSGRPWIGPSAVARTIGAALAAVVAFVALSALGLLGLSVLGIPLFAIAAGILAFAWLASIAGLIVMRASYRYVLRQSSVEVDRGIVSRRSLVVSPSAFAELEVEQGVMGRMMNYGSLEVRSQGGQQLNLWLIRDPKGVSTRIREVMTVPTVKVARDEGAGAPGSS